MTTGPAEIPFTQTQVGMVKTLDDVADFAQWLRKPRDVLAFDTETSGINPRDKGARIRLAQFGDVNEAWSIDCQMWPGLVREVIESYKGKFVVHNGAFDYSWMAVHFPGIKLPWSRTSDTMTLARIDPNLTSAALKPLSVQFIGPAAGVGQQLLEDGMHHNKWSWDSVPMDFPPYSQYAALDCVLTARLYRKLQHLETGPTSRVVKLEHEVRRIANNMQLKGFRVDRPYCEEKLISLEQYVLDAKKYCQETFGVQIGSTQQLANWFIDAGVELTERTPKGAPKMTEEVLEILAPKYSLAEMALKTRKADKLRGSYFKNILEYSENDGLVHCQINTLEARTGRMSATKPALQTLPAKGEGAAVRRAFLPMDDGHVLYSADYSSIESRLAAHFGDDDNMAEAFRAVDEDPTGKTDFFVELGKKIWDPNFQKSDPRRAVAKVIVYSGLYGAGVAKMAGTAGVSESEMRKIREDFFDSFPAIRACQNRFSKEAEATVKAGSPFPYVTSYFGRELRIDPEKVYTAANYAIQGHAAEILKQAIVNCDMAGLGDFLTLPVHDELVFDVPKDLDPVEVINEIRECMEVTKEMGYKVPLPVSPEGPMDRWDAK